MVEIFNPHLFDYCNHAFKLVAIVHDDEHNESYKFCPFGKNAVNNFLSELRKIDWEQVDAIDTGKGKF